ncbi:MAG: cupin domain-containing protein [Phycisphaerales bacterium]|jgi:predicted cupin superfamily sugar epimerase
MKPQDRSDSPTAEELIQRLELLPHPEGGFYRETWRHNPSVDERGQGTAIYFLLPGGVTNRWHRVDATEIWHHYGGASLELRLSAAPPTADRLIRLGQNILDGELPQAIVQPHEWQSAKSLGDWTLVGCTVSPAFEFDGFELLDD